MCNHTSGVRCKNCPATVGDIEDALVRALATARDEALESAAQSLEPLKPQCKGQEYDVARTWFNEAQKAIRALKGKS